MIRRNAEAFVMAIRTDTTPMAAEIAAAFGRAMSHQVIADCWIAIASAMTAMMRDVPEGDRAAVATGIAMLIDQMLALPRPHIDDGITWPWPNGQ